MSSSESLSDRLVGSFLKYLDPSMRFDRSLDEVFLDLDDGIEEEDIELSIFRHGLSDDKTRDKLTLGDGSLSILTLNWREHISI